MKWPILAAFVFAAVPAAAGDPVHTDQDLGKELRGLSWLLGNWEGQGRIAQTDYNEYARWWPSADGRMLLEDAYAADTSGAIIHEDRIAIWKTRKEPVRCVLFEAAPPRCTEFEVRVTGEAVEFVPRVAGGPAMTFRRKGGDEFTYDYAAKGADGKELKASGSIRRSMNDYPARLPEKLSDPFKPLGAALGTFEGDCSSGNVASGKAVLSGTPMFDGSVLEVLLRVASGDSAGGEIRAWLWWEPDSDAWAGRVVLSTTGAWSGPCQVREGELVFEPAEGGRLDWKWQAETASWRMVMDDDGREIEHLSFTGKRVARDK